MELKRDKCPSGPAIETQLKSLLFFHQILLIVPYGIETGLWESYRSLRQCLLIVPYGIETNHYNNRKDLLPLLIVPYGIETDFGCFPGIIIKHF